MNNYEQAVAQEEENRRLALLGIARPVCGVPQVALTWRHVCELTQLGNAYFAGTAPTPHDTWQFLWRLHPHFTWPDGTVSPGCPHPGRLRSLISRARLAWVWARLDPQTAEMLVCTRILDSYQDAPRGDAGGEGHASSLCARLKWAEHFWGYYSTRGLSLDQFANMSIASCFSSLRAYYIRTGQADTLCIPPSAALKRFED